MAFCDLINHYSLVCIVVFGQSHDQCLCSCSKTEKRAKAFAMDLLAYDVSEQYGPPLNTNIVPRQIAARTINVKEPALEDEIPKTKNCKLRYRVRWFSSKGAFLVLLWSILLNFSAGSLSTAYRTFSRNKLDSTTVTFLADFLPYIAWGIFNPLAGWLADFYFGTYRVTRFGVLLLFLSTIVNCILFQLANYVLKFDSLIFISLFDISNAIGLTGQGIVLVTLMTLGLHQMPDVSTDSITSFISWYVCSYYVGYWVCDITSYIPFHCMNVYTDYIRIWSLFPVLAMGIVLVSDFFLVPKWLIIEPKSPQFSKTIYQVLKFAAKNKSPLRRSAFTFWEEDIPSRIDLGKSKYGGPFTTEEAEDVKTLFRLLVISVPIFFIIVSYNLWAGFPAIWETDKQCGKAIIKYVIGDIYNTVVLGTIVYEFLVYPFIARLLPGIFKRIGMGSFLIVLLNAVYLGLYIATVLNPSLTWSWLGVPHAILVGIVKIVWLTSMLELAVAQSPYKMRGLTIGYLWGLVLFTQLVFYIDVCTETYCQIIHGSVAFALSVVGFVLYCILARWYKRRVRDDIATPHKWAEEAYDRYLKH